MDNTSKRPVVWAGKSSHVELRRLDWAKTLSEKTLTAITDACEWVELDSGEVIIGLDSEVTHVHFLITGRLQGTLYDLLGKEIQQDAFFRGSVVGLFSLGLSDRSHIQVQATEPSTAIRLTLSHLLRLTARYPDFQLTMFRLAATIFKRYLTVDRSRPKPSVVGIVHQTEASRPLTARLAHRLQALGESPCIAGDDKGWMLNGSIPFKLLDAGSRELRQEILRDWAAHRRLIVDVRVNQPSEVMARFLSYVDIVLWCIRPQDVGAAIAQLQALVKGAPGWRQKIRIVWLLDNNNPVAPYVAEFSELAERDFKLTFEPPGANQGTLLQHGLDRIVHHLRGVQIGLALGGGAARGMAHLGVLKALEQQGIYIDMLAGTSAGAMTGTLYALGFDPEYLARCFTSDLQPSWLFRRLPSGGYWYLLYKYRRHQFDPMLRKYLGQARMEQLAIPAFTVSVDLVEGKTLVSDTGDATISVLESINLPPLALPMMGSSQAFVDGGLLNNIPADVLVAKGCNFVIASTVTAKLEKDFAGLRSDGHSLGRRAASSIQVIMRQNMIQHHKMNAVGIQPADFVIAPDVTSFDISEFTRAGEMARIGEATTNAVIAKLHRMLGKLDPKLFERWARDQLQAA
jgi:predicted acylesterase/phospholipase RssA/CRP-like cAMP-binding protein